MTTVTQPLGDQQLREAVVQFVGSDIYRGLIAERRAEAGRRRAELLAELPVGAAAERKAIDAAGKARWQAVAAVEQAEAALSAAKAEAHAAFLKVESLTSQARRRSDRITTELRELADPRIGELRFHLEFLEERARHAARPTLTRVVPAWGGSERVVHDWNIDGVEAARATLRELINECAGLVLGDYGVDVAPKLRDILARAEAAADSLALYDGENAAGYRLQRHQIGD
jgi:small-conductance mechanosensitive channel